MRWWDELKYIARKLDRRRAERELDEEIRAHLEMETEEQIEAGRRPEEARSAARRAFGSVAIAREDSRAIWGFASVETLWQDVRYGARMLLKHKGFTVAAVLTLGLGIGANTAIFSLIDAVLLRMLPVDRPEQLYFIQNVGPRRPDGGAPPYPCFARFRAQSRSFTGLAAFTELDLRVRIDGQREEVRGQFVSGNYFSLLGVSPALGRLLRPADDTVPQKGGQDGMVAVISYNYWTRRFGRSPEVIGKVVHVGADPVTIVGVSPPEFYGLIPGTEIDISLPIMFEGERRLTDKSTWWFKAVGRLEPDASVEQAQAELNTIFQSFMDEAPVSAEMRRDVFARIELAPASRGLNTLRRQFSRPLQALMGMVALVLIIACANVANLLLARSTARRREFALRLALGANRRRLLRQLLTESLLLVSLGGLLGLLFARWGGATLMSFFAAGRNQVLVNLALDHRVLLFTAAVTLLTGLFFGLAPALQATRIDPVPALKETASNRSRSRFGKSLVVAQIALSLILLVGAGLFLRTLRNLENFDAGFERQGVVTMRINPDVTVYRDGRLAALWKEILSRVEGLPGVRAASLSSLYPLDGNDRSVRVEVAGFTPQSESDRDIRLNQVSPGFFQTFGVALLEGRVFAESDNEAGTRVALLNETAARFYFGDRSPIGGLLSFKRSPGAEPMEYQVVGVVRDSRYNSLREPETRLVYLPMSQSIDQMGRLSLAARGDGRAGDLINAIRGELGAAGRDILVTNIATLDEQVDQSLLQERLVATLSLFFGLLALLLACIGLYGVMSYSVARRRQEFGIRMALGARPGVITQSILREALLLAAIGIGVGLPLVFVAARLIRSQLFGVQPDDPVTFVIVTCALVTVVLLAAWLPARRATKVNPIVALRSE